MTSRSMRSAIRPTAELARHISYSPDLDGDADPGEIVWTWVAYEDDPNQGKDRPVLVVGRDGGPTDEESADEESADGESADDGLAGNVLGLMLSSKDHHGEGNWFAVGSGSWDSQNRPSSVRLDRVLVVDADGIRREGAVLDQRRFDAVAEQLRDRYGWR
ncbi:type II toxin-antitoxin system PemK/MazF family toxin [Gordonia sp. 'Campus']|uniref:type II toxin-antitoxin system PemK/MazF family toxin n=1 Tax=Gordonia sp. 'Campus' TaxID=2915824 RepID=UPI001EE45CB0|nr:type II toxin-antitoxin system PemK/MazF family toxin [Gordonia sp. 'Campus']